MLKAYCDACTKGTKAVATSLILTDNRFIACFSHTYEEVESSTHAELLGILQTVQFIHDKCDTSTRVFLYTDNLSIVSQCIRVLAKWEVPNDFRNPELFKQFLDYSKDMNITIQHIRGHQRVHNPNKVCDALSKVKFELEE